MAKYSNQVVYDIKTTLDASGITKLQSELAKVQSTLNSLKGKKDFKLGLNIDELESYREEIEKLSRVLTTTFNTRTGMLDLNKFNAALKNGTINAERLNAAFNATGNQGKIAFNSLVTSITTLNKNAITANSTLTKIANTFGNTVRWGITASIFQEMLGSVQGAVSYMKNLDESLTNIQMVTNSSKEDMRELAQYANNAAQALGSTTTDYTNAVKVFVQEGFSESESKQYANLSTKLANVSEQDTATTSDQITAYRNAFQLDYQQTAEAMDKVANVANNTASNVNELMTASQRAASVAQAVGSSQDSFLAAIATIQSVTRQSAEEIGNGLKTIYQRFADIKVSGKTEDGVDYGQYAKALKQIGVDVLDAQGEFKGMDQILKETQEVWSSLSDTMKVAVGEKVAGKFQYNRFAALMNNQAYYEKSYAATQNASGMMDQMNEYYMEGIEGRLNTLQAAGEQVMSTLFDQDNIEPIIEAATDFLNIINTIIDTVGGGVPVFTALSAVILKTFSAQIGEQAARIATNISTMIQGGQNVKQMQTTLTGLQANGIAVNTDTYEYAKNSVGSMVGLSSNTQQEWSNTIAKSAEIEEQMLQAEEKYNEVVGLANSKLEARYKISSHIKDMEASKSSITKEEIVAFEQIKEILSQTIILDEENFSIDQNLLKQKVAIAKLLAEGKDLSYQEVMVESEKIDLLGADLSITESILQAERERQAAQQQHNAQLEVQKQLDERMSMEQQGKSITNLVSGLTSVVFLAQSAMSIWQTWTDENTSFEDKVVGSLMSLAMILPMVTTAWQALTAVKIADLQATVAQTTASIASAAAQGLLTLAVAAESAGFIGLSEAIFAASVALEATPVGWILTAIMAIVAVIAGAVIAFNTWQESIHASSKEFEAQRELLNKTKKNYSEAREEVDALKQSIDAIGETKTSLEDLTKGTDEWREAVRKLNDQVLTLLQTYPELAQYVKNEDGVLSIDDVGMDQFYQQQLNEADHLANINSVQQINTLQAQNKKYIEDFSNQWGLSKEEISSAIEEGAYSLEGKSDLLNASFAELVNKVQINSTSIDNLSDNIGTLNTTYSDYSSKENINLDEVKETIREQYGVSQYDEYGNSTETKLDFSTMTNNQEFLDAVAEATGKNIISATDTSWFDDNVKFKTNDGDEFEYTTDQLLNLLADSQAAIDATNKKLEENRTIYEAFGAKYDEASKKFIDSSGETVSSLEDLNGVTSDEIAAIKAFQDGIYNDIAVEDFYGSLEEFVTELKNGALSVDGFSEALLAAQVQQKEEGIFGDEGRLTSLSQTQGVTANVDGVPENLKLSSGQAKAIMADMMKKLNESNLSDDEKLQLMDKIDWNMPVQDILANIQHAIDTGNINSAFVDTSGLEDDSERKSKVLEDYDISESTLNTYTEQLQTTGELAEQHKKLADSLEYAKEQFGEESDEAKDARKALSAFDNESEDMAVNLAQTQKGLEALSNGMSKYGDILKNGDKTTLEYAEALGAMKKALADTLNVSEESISNSTIEEHLGDIEALAAGDQEALNNLRIAASQDIVAGFYMAEDSTLTEDHMEYLKQKAIEVNSLDIEVGADINDEEFTNALNDMLYNGELTKDQVNEYLHGIGAEPHFETIKKETTLFSTAGMRVKGELFGVPYDFGLPPFEITGMVDVPQIVPEGKTAQSGGGSSGGGTGLRRTASPTAPSGQTGISPSYVNDAYKPDKNSNNKNGDKEKQPKNNQKKEKETSEWDYLTDITNDLDRAAAAMEKLTKLEDRLFGANRISQLKKLQSEYKNYIKLLQQEVKIAQRHAETLRTQAYDENGNLTMNGYAYRAGVGQLQFDAQGNLDNGRQIEQALLKRMNDAIDEYNEHRNDEDTGQYEWNVNQTKSDYDGFMKAMSEYESTLGKIEDSQSAIQDYKEKIQDAADSIIDAIQENLDNVIDAINNRRDFNRTYRNWQEGGNSYSHFNNDRNYYIEGLQGLLSSRGNDESVFDLQLNSLKDRIKDAEDIFDNDSNNADDEKLSEQAAFENLKESTSSIMETLNQMIDYYDSILETVQEASDKMDELIDSRLKSFDNIEKRLGTRLDQIKLLFGDKSYEKQAQVYQQEVATNMAKLETIADAIKVKQATVDSLEKLEEKNKELSTEERQALQDAREKITELQEEQLDTETKTLQAIRNQKETTITAEVNNMVQEMFNGADIDWLSQQWELASRNSEKYLDDYNRAFEIQKLELKFQEALNDNQHASLMTQQKINDLANEYLTYLREKERLSDYDVKHAQMQLDILQKQIALEDARNNKSQMRLQRNAAGNYDFVYGANEDEVNKATEALLQAQQDSYNLSKQMYLDTYEAAFEAAMKVRDMVVEVAMDASLNTEQQVERIHYILENLNEYMQGSSVELGEISINLYNSFVEASQAVAEINQGALSDIFDQMEQRAIAVQETINSTTEAINGQFDLFNENANGQITGIYDNIISVVDQIQNSIIGEDGSLSNIGTGIEKFEQGLIGSDGTLNKIKVGTDATLIELSNDIILPVLNTIDDRFNLTGENAILNVEGIETAIQIASINITGTTTKNLDDIDNSVKETLINIFDYIKDTNGNIEILLDGDVTRVQDNGKIIKDVYNEVDEHLKEKFENSSSYLQQFQRDTEEACSAAEDNFDTFTEDAVKEANQALKDVRGETQNWKNDLNKLNGIINDGRDAMNKWKNKIDEAWQRADNFTSKSFNLQERLANIGGLAAYSADRFGDIRDIAPEAGYAANTMENDIASGYETLRSSAVDAKNALDDLRSAVDYAQRAMDNLDFNDTVRKAWDAVNDVNEAFSNMPSGADFTAHTETYVYYDNPWNWASDEYGQGIWAYYDTGGYTGKWFDEGIGADDGKLAVLHQKELVLNASDTENMLSAVELVRDIMSNINQLPSIGKNIGQNTFSDNIEQRVEISATFPGVTEAIEIKQALEQIADNAYQVANRYKY